MCSRFTIRSSGLCAASLVFLTRAAVGGPIEELQPGHWYEVPNSTMISVAPRPLPPGVEGPIAVMQAASGGAYDTKRDRLLVWGGGSRSYSGNEVYGFDLASLKWMRITEPSSDVGGYFLSGYYPDGAPRGRHTYDYIEYIPPPVDRFCSFGAAAMYPLGQPDVGNVDCLDLDSGRWERKANAVSYGLGATSAYDPVTGHVFVHGSGGRKGFLTEFDPVRNRWTTRGHPGSDGDWTPYELTADIHPRMRKYVAAGNGKVYVWDLGQGNSQRTELITTGAREGVQVYAPGFAYDPILDRFVAWSGGADVYLLDLEKRAWTKKSPAPTNKVSPPPATKRGTHGRFRYVPSKNVYIVVSSVYENVYIYKLTSDPKRSN